MRKKIKGGDKFKLEYYCVDPRPEFISTAHCHDEEIEMRGENSKHNDILFMGDSWTAGWDNYLPTPNYARSIMNNLPEEYEYAYYPNSGAFGYTSKDLLKFITDKTINARRLRKIIRSVGIIVILIGINDTVDIMTHDNISLITSNIIGLNPEVKILVFMPPENLKTKQFIHNNMADFYGYKRYEYEIAKCNKK